MPQNDYGRSKPTQLARPHNQRKPQEKPATSKALIVGVILAPLALAFITWLASRIEKESKPIVIPAHLERNDYDNRAHYVPAHVKGSFIMPQDAEYGKKAK